ncbi:MAG: glycosyltransferase family 4 protein [Bryobacteraceae bacterium]|nr:glycosyltransferase family 4 protein [Bryobacteraceae bacterium]MDW8378914.1 glycosyltransferase family 1 protein [Bryobacterales bacterium]
MAFSIALDARHVRDFGVGTYIRNLVQALAKIDDKNHYTLITYRRDASLLAGLPSNFRILHYEINDTEFRDNFAFPMFLKRLRVDLHHMPLPNIPLLMPKPYVVTVHDVSRLLFEQVSGWRNDLHRYQLRRGLMRAERIFAVSEATRLDVESLLNIPPDHVTVIPNAPDPRFFEHSPPADSRAAGPDIVEHEKRRILERYQITYPFLLYAGTIRPQKNIPRLVEAFAVLRGELENHPIYKDLRLIIIGDEISRFPDVRRTVVQTRTGNAVRFLGFVPFDTLRVFYETAEAFVFPSLYEGFGLPPLEAMASGTPVVTSNVSSLPEVTGDAAVVVNPENVFDIARGMKEVLLDENLRSRLVKAGLEQARRFSWERTAKQVLRAYEECLGVR